MRRWWLILVVAVMLTTQAKPLHAAWLKNLAILKLTPVWITQNTLILDPICITQGKFPIVEKYLESSAIMDPRNLSALTDLGRALWLEGDYTAAVARWEQASKNHDPAAEYELFRIGEYETFSPDLRRMLANYAFNHAADLAKDPKPINEAAYQWFNRAFELVPERKTIIAIIQLHLNNGGTFDASGLWQQMIDVLPDTNAEYWYAVGEVDNLNTNWESAASSFTEGAELAPDSYDFWMRAGDAWEQLYNWDQAVASYERANLVHPEYIYPYLSLGTAYYIQQKYQAAVYWYSKAMKLFPQVSDPYFFLGETFYWMGDDVQARRNLEAALKIAPINTFSMYYLAQVSYREKNPNQAEAWLVDAINHESNPQNFAPWWVQLGDWRLEWHNCSGAFEAYTNASHAGENEETMQPKLKALMEVCGS